MQSGLNVASKRIITAEAKQKALVSSLAIKIAKQMGDPDYEKYKTYREMAFEIKKRIIKKYAPVAIKVLKEKGHNIKISHQDLSD